MHIDDSRKTLRATITVFNQACKKIITRYEKEMISKTNQSLDILDDVYSSYIQKHKQWKQQSQYQTQTVPNTSLAIISKKKQTINAVQKSIKKDPEKGHKSVNFRVQFLEKPDQNNIEILDKLKRLSMCQKENTQDNENEQEQLLKLENKSLEEIIMASKRKNISEAQLEPVSDQQSEYAITEYSSNQSSNENQGYDQEYRSQQGSLLLDSNTQPLFGNLFTKNEHQSFKTLKSIPVTQLTFTFKAKQLMNSPKKSNKKKKRLYIRHKKIPMWAQDLEQIKKKVFQQNKTINPKQIFGMFLVQNLDSDIIFKVDSKYQRTSSVKWNPKNIFLD